jgi:carboxylate-amine ligase
MDEIVEESETALRLPMFSAYGVELEYMIVDKVELNVAAITDKVIHHVTGEYISDADRGNVGWSNELALHVIELKTPEPEASLKGLEERFQNNINEINAILRHSNAMLMPTGMHPWMDPFKEMHLWPHEQSTVYEAFNRIFDCRGHGWANLQSTHLNLAFSNDDEFALLHSAIRALLPILPALAASSPFTEGAVAPFLNNRLKVYLDNSKKLPSITADCIPEPIFSQEQYQIEILDRIYRDIAPYDPEKILQYEWLNARGAIARFERFTIEIRTLDVQECPAADIAIIQFIVATLKKLLSGTWASINEVKHISQKTLVEVFMNCIKDGEQTVIKDPQYLKLFGVKASSVSVKDLLSHIHQNVDLSIMTPATQNALKVILKQGPLARRILNAWNKQPTREKLVEIYRSLCHCLDHGKMFI